VRVGRRLFAVALAGTIAVFGCSESTSTEEKLAQLAEELRAQPSGEALDNLCQDVSEQLQALNEQQPDVPEDPDLSEELAVDSWAEATSHLGTAEDVCGANPGGASAEVQAAHDNLAQAASLRRNSP
jgi:hypothetical protein